MLIMLALQTHSPALWVLHILHTSNIRSPTIYGNVLVVLAFVYIYKEILHSIGILGNYYGGSLGRFDGRL